MPRFREWDLKCKVYVGNLGSSCSKTEIENAFGKYGALRNVWVARNPPGFAFVEFEDSRDAEDAVRALDGTWVTCNPINRFLLKLYELLVELLEQEFALKCHLAERVVMKVEEEAVVHEETIDEEEEDVETGLEKTH